MVHIQEWLIQVGEVQVVLGFVVLCKCLVFRGRELAEWRQVCIHISNIEAMRLVEVAIPEEKKRHGSDFSLFLLWLLQPRATAVPWNNDSILVVLQLEAEGILFGVLRSRNASTGLRLFNVFHELKVHV